MLEMTWPADGVASWMTWFEYDWAAALSMGGLPVGTGGRARVPAVPGAALPAPVVAAF